ncbi:DinB family protein [Pueribacillus theae]|uniref:DinB family protein n=1 Tax=Pueribacillus theae TaxID=2171751 RepID=A0A2U1K670_9BACI|nr:DinB family protein [Pueribacillus theae]PWA12659.1 DinB family protein [Pueribacillus theae]
MKAIEQFVHINDLRDRFFPQYETITQEQLEWKTDGYANNIAFLLRHTAQAEDWFLHAVILEKQDFTPKRKKELTNTEEIMDYLKETRENTINFLEQNEMSILKETRTMPDGFRGKNVENPTVEWIVKRMFDHEVYHLAQVNILLRLQGIDPPSM